MLKSSQFLASFSIGTYKYLSNAMSDSLRVMGAIALRQGSKKDAIVYLENLCSLRGHQNKAPIERAVRS